MKSPLISIIIPCYNVEKYLDRCLDSIVCQTLNDIEVILVDDCSQDYVPQMCDQWVKRDSRVKVIHKKRNEGLGFARNTGLNIATGEYVAFVDSDDYIVPSMYETLYDATENGKMDVVYCGVRQESALGKFQLINDFDQTVYFDKNNIDKVALSFVDKTDICTGRLYMSVWHGIYKKNIIDKNNIRFYSERSILSEDIPFQIEFCKNSKNIKFIPQYLYCYCYNQDSLSRSFNIQKFSAVINLRNLLLRLTHEYSEGKDMVDVEFYSRIRNLLSVFIFSNNFSLKEKYNIVRKLCVNSIWNNLNTMLLKQKSWKHIMPYRLLRANCPTMLILFYLFDKVVNKHRLYFWKNKI